MRSVSNSSSVTRSGAAPSGRGASPAPGGDLSSGDVGVDICFVDEIVPVLAIYQPRGVPQQILDDHRPALWLETISTYRGSASSAPNFAYEYCLRPDKLPAETLEHLGVLNLGAHGRIEIIKGHVNLILAQNPGAAWGILRDESEALRRPLFIAISLAAIVFIVSLFRKLLQGTSRLARHQPHIFIIM